MENWRYILEHHWQQHRRNIKRYSLCLWAIIAGASTDRHYLAWAALIAATAMYSHDRWLHTWAARGRKILNQPEPKDP